MSTKPTIVVVPGAWHIPEHFDPTAKVLRSKGYKVIGVRTPSARQSGPWVDLYADAAAVSSAILTECDAGNDVVVIMHSLGGVAGSAGVKGLGKKEREEKGLKGGVIRLIYLSAFVVEEGVSLSEAFGFQRDADMQSPWCPIYEHEYTFPNEPVNYLYHDVAEDTAKWAVSLLQNQSYNVNFQKQICAPWKYIPSTYIRLTEDRALPLQYQEMMSSQPDGLWTIESMETAHSPFLNKPDETATLIEKNAK